MPSTKICAVPWTEAYTTTMGTYGLCCIENSDFNHDKVGLDQPFQNHWNGPYMKSVRQKFMDGSDLPQCQVCWHDETCGKTSMRQRRNQRYLGEPDPGTGNQQLAEILAITDQDGHTDCMPTGINFSTGTTCQLRCIECSPSYSRSIVKDYQKLEWNPNFKTRRAPDTFDIIMDQNLLDQHLWPMLRDIAPTLRWLQITGGEPTISRTLLDFLQWMIEQGYHAQTSIVINTNAVNIKQEFIHTLQKFKLVIFGLSVDGHGDLDEYIRYPTRWDKKSKMIDQLIDLFPKSNIITAVTSLNINKLDDLIEWTLMHGYDLTPLIVSRPDNLSCHHLPEALKDQARSMLQSCQTLIAAKIKTSTQDKVAGHQELHSALSGLINYMDRPRTELTWQQAVDIMRSYDTIRPRSIGDLNPVLRSYL